MSKKFVVSLHGTPLLRDPITNYLMAKGWHLWHWYADLWLLSGVPDLLTAGTLYQEMQDGIPGLIIASLIVIEMGPELRYFGRAPKAEAWDWMKEHWGTVDIPVPLDQAAQSVSEPAAAKTET
jgi:hypothetical protein